MCFLADYTFASSGKVQVSIGLKETQPKTAKFSNVNVKVVFVRPNMSIDVNSTEN